MSYIQQPLTHRQIYPSFMPGYPLQALPQTPYNQRYHNIGQLDSPYAGKKGIGDYSWPQHTIYYTCNNDNYPYDLEPRHTYPKDCSWCTYPRDFRHHPYYKFKSCFYSNSKE